MKPTIPEYLVCPVCKGSLKAIQGERLELACPACALAYEVRDGIPSMIKSQARELSDAEKARLREAKPSEGGER